MLSGWALEDDIFMMLCPLAEQTHQTNIRHMWRNRGGEMLDNYAARVSFNTSMNRIPICRKLQ